jgi:hypothetical protein
VYPSEHFTKKWIKSSKTVVKPPVGLGEGLTEWEGVVLGESDFEAEGETEAEGEGVGLELAEGEGEGLRLTLEEGETDKDGD